jgi:hypothetical protein
MKVIIKVKVPKAKREYTIDTEKCHEKGLFYVTHYGCQQSMADSTASCKSTQDAVEKADARFDQIMMGTIEPGQGGGAKLPLHLKVLRDLVAEKCNIKRVEITARLKDEDACARALVLHVAASGVNRGVFPDLDKALASDKVHKVASDAYLTLLEKAYAIADTDVSTELLEIDTDTEEGNDEDDVDA